MAASITEDLARDEGREEKPYKDTKGLWTIGIGHNLDAEGLCDEAIDAQFRFDLRTKAVEPLDKYLPWWREHPEAVQRVLLNLMFNMGPGTLLKFKETLALIQERKYAAAGDRLLTLPYAKQVGQRANRLAKLLKGVL